MTKVYLLKRDEGVTKDANDRKHYMKLLAEYVRKSEKGVYKYSKSYSEQYLVYGISDGIISCDAEKIIFEEPYFVIEKKLKFFLNEEQQILVLHKGSLAKNFTLIWTRKEAYFKAFQTWKVDDFNITDEALCITNEKYKLQSLIIDDTIFTCLIDITQDVEWVELKCENGIILKA